ncbi:MAG: DJ-1/PfpI family protein [Firmicutes bacterium]|nr:DJ-1/PfpI family protein [Bacillota bacterium]
MGKTVALIIAERNFRDEEYQKPKEILEKAGIIVLTASTSLGTAVGKLGMTAKPDLLIGDLENQDLAALIFVGGGGSSQYFEDQTAHRLVRRFYEQGKIVGAICIAPVILANAGLLKGKRATVFPDGKADLEKNGAVYTGKPVEVDGTIITGAGPEAAVAFGEGIVEMLKKV